MKQMLTLEKQLKKHGKKEKKTHFNQQITAKTKKLLEKLCKKSRLSKPMQLEAIVEEAVIRSEYKYS